MDQKWSHIKVLGKYFEVYGQAFQITPEAGKKKAPFSLKQPSYQLDGWSYRNFIFLVLGEK